MFPPPHEALPLPPHPDIETYRELAKGRKAQLALARNYGFETWSKFAAHVRALARNSPVSRFEAAVDAIVAGNLAELSDLLRAHPKLVGARSTRVHAATLLIYVAANGVESYRQKTPPNIVEIAELLLHAGAEVNAEANVYGGGCATLELVATSIHPERAGVQLQLLQKLLDHGASIEKPSLITACLGNGRPKAAEFLAAHGARIDLPAAAGLGQIETVRALFDPANSRDAFLYACAYGRNSVVEFLLEEGVDLTAHRRDGQTALHWAVIGGHPDTVKLLLRHNPPLEAVNTYGGTVMGQALWSAANGGNSETYIEILETLRKAGAKLPEVHGSITPRIDAWLAAQSK
jgi:hypothetical protein